jgi:hypothetical protein
MKKILIGVITGSIFFGCNTYLYKFSILEPTTTQTKQSENNQNNSQFTFSDSFIDITMSIASHDGMHGSAIIQNYDGISFSLINKTDSVLILDWNKISFIDASGSSGGSVMHENIKYTDCASMKPPSTIPPHGKISDIITPCSGVYFQTSSGQYGSSGWVVNMLPFANEVTNTTFGFYMPISFGTMIKNYSFKFKGESYQAQ